VRQGGPTSPLLMLARGGIAAAVIVLLGIVLFVLKRRNTLSPSVGRKA
jgi:hypothetical protein